LLAPLRRGGVLGRQHAARLGSGAGALFGAGAGQRIPFGGALGVRRTCRGSDAIHRDLAALPLGFHQPAQQFAQVQTPESD
jgi:hypothetical protein